MTFGAGVVYISNQELALDVFNLFSKEFDKCFLPIVHIFNVSFYTAKLIFSGVMIVLLVFMSAYYVIGSVILRANLDASKLSNRFFMITNGKNKPMDALVVFIKVLFGYLVSVPLMEILLK